MVDLTSDTDNLPNFLLEFSLSFAVAWVQYGAELNQCPIHEL